MPKPHLPYAAEFRRQIIELVHAGRTPAELSRGFQVTAQTLPDWVRRADVMRVNPWAARKV